MSGRPESHTIINGERTEPTYKISGELAAALEYEIACHGLNVVGPVTAYLCSALVRMSGPTGSEPCPIQFARQPHDRPPTQLR